MEQHRLTDARPRNRLGTRSVVPRMRTLSLALFVLFAPLAGHAEAQCTASPSVTEAPVPAIALPGQANAIVARAAVIEALATTDPSRPQAMLELATAYRATGDRELAIRTLARIVEAHPDWSSMDRVFVDLGRDLFALGRGEQARAVFFRLIRNYPASPWVSAAYAAFGDYYYGEADFPVAVQFYERVVLARGPMLAYAHYRLAWARARLHEPGLTNELERARVALSSPGVLSSPALRTAIQTEGPAIAALARCP